MAGVSLRNVLVGDGQPTYIVAEIGLNHNGSVLLAKQLIDAAKLAGCNAVKFQKRTPDLAVPPAQRDVPRETPWGTMTYIEYRHRVEFGKQEYQEIDRYCRERSIAWFASAWDEPSIDVLEQFDLPAYKIPSAALTDTALLRHARAYGRPLVVSTGMSTAAEIRSAVAAIGDDNLVLTHCTSTYPCVPAELNLRMLTTLKRDFNCPIGYSGHEVGLQTTLAAVVLGATFVERHITLDRAMWGSDHAASLEPQGLSRLVRDIRIIEAAMGDGIKQVYASELPMLAKLRRANSVAAAV
jgi:N-acetylneuraminate synthase